jgi:hypothetical protein
VSEPTTPPEQTPTVAAEPPARRRGIAVPQRLQTVIAAVLIVGAFAGLFFVGRAAVTGTDSTSANLPEAVERLVPASGASVLRQSQVGLDLADGYDAYLIINGTEIRSAEDGLIRDLGTGQILYQPGPDKPVETLNAGQNCITAMVWQVLETAATANAVPWCFEAT